MKHFYQKSLAVLLAVLMLACAFPIASFAVACPTCKTGTLTEKITTIPATCTEPGYQIIGCTTAGCAGQKTKNADPLGHNWTDKVDAKYLKDAAYCKGPAVYYQSCSVCGVSAKDDSTAVNKTFNDPSGKTDENNHRSIEVGIPEEPATCTKEGKTAIGKCKDCGKDYVGGKPIPMLAHTPKTPANCVDKAVCAKCGQSYGEIDANNHKTVVTDKAVAATCKAEGLTEGSHCEACKKTIKQQQTQPKTAHKTATNNVAATCTTAGVTGEVKCTVCGEVVTKGTAIPATGHKWGAWTAQAGYTCAAGGTVSHTCSVCKASESKTLKAGEHAAVVDAAVPATCTAAGKAEGSHCQFCSTVIKQQTATPALGHSFTGKVVANKDGTHAFQCERCDVIGGAVKCVDRNRDCVCDQCAASIPHTFTDYKADGNATCVADGTKTAVCDICGKAKDTIADEGSKATAAHSYTFVSQNDAGCLTNAHEVGTCALCGVTLTREIENSALGHASSDWKFQEGYDCTLGGYRYKECTRCAAELARENVEPAEHVRVKDSAVDVTCTTDGKTEGAHCSVCGYVFTAQAIIPSEGHKANAAGFTVVRTESCEQDGEQTAVCSVCGEAFSKIIPATGHKYVTSVVKAGCTTKGYTNHKCSLCGKQYNDNTVKATGHNWKITVKQATTKKDGSKTYTCTVCKKKVVKTIAKIQTVKLSATVLAKTGQKQTPAVIVKNSAGKTLKKGVAYTVKYAAGRKNLGTYTVTVTFIGNYSGTKTLKFKIVPAAAKTVKATAAGKNVTVNWSKVAGGDKYVVYYSTAKNGKYKRAGTATQTTLTVRNLKAGTYFFKVRAVRTLDSGNLNGELSAPAKVQVK